MVWKQIRRIDPLGNNQLHVEFFYALRSGLLRQAVRVALPHEVLARFIMPDSAPHPQCRTAASTQDGTARK
jgi:hypothetical protein